MQRRQWPHVESDARIADPIPRDPCPADHGFKEKPMQRFLLLALASLSLAGCHASGTSMTSRTDENGVRLYSKIFIKDNVASFHCVESSSGACHYTLFPRDCRTSDCAMQPIQRFDVAVGDERRIAGLTDFHPCVSHEAVVPKPDCGTHPAH
jgi:hypothetical protein